MVCVREKRDRGVRRGREREVPPEHLFSSPQKPCCVFPFCFALDENQKLHRAEMGLVPFGLKYFADVFRNTEACKHGSAIIKHLHMILNQCVTFYFLYTPHFIYV